MFCFSYVRLCFRRGVGWALKFSYHLYCSGNLRWNSLVLRVQSEGKLQSLRPRAQRRANIVLAGFSILQVVGAVCFWQDTKPGLNLPPEDLICPSLLAHMSNGSHWICSTYLDTLMFSKLPKTTVEQTKLRHKPIWSAHVRTRWQEAGPVSPYSTSQCNTFQSEMSLMGFPCRG